MWVGDEVYGWDKPINLQVLPPFASIDHRGCSARQRTFEKRFKETKTGMRAKGMRRLQAKPRFRSHFDSENSNPSGLSH